MIYWSDSLQMIYLMLQVSHHTRRGHIINITVILKVNYVDPQEDTVIIAQ